MFGVLRETCGGVFWAPLWIKSVSKTLQTLLGVFASVEAERRRMLGVETMERVCKITIMRWLQGVQYEHANFFAAKVKFVCDPIPRRACGVIGRVLLLSFANVLVLPFATRYLVAFCSI